MTVMELCCTDLHSVLYHNDFPLLPSVIKRLLADLLKGVHAMHTHGTLSEYYPEDAELVSEPLRITCCYDSMLSQTK